MTVVVMLGALLFVKTADQQRTGGDGGVLRLYPR
jgi:hypothetical protein